MPTFTPGKLNPTQTTTSSPSAQDARARAISIIQNGGIQQSQESPVSNPNQVSPEEMTAVNQNKTLAEVVEENKSQDSEIIEETKTDNQETEEKERQINKVEAKDKAESEETDSAKSKDPLSSQYAVLARKEKALRAKVQAQEASFKTREEALKAREEALSSKESQYKQGYISKEEFAKNPWKHLAEAGVSYDQLTEMALSSKQIDPLVMSQIEKLQSELTAEREARRQFEEKSIKTAEEQQTKAYQQAVNQLKVEAKQLVESDPENFEAIAAAGAADDIVELIEATWKEEGILLSVEDAAKQVEDYLAEEALKLAKLKKVQSKLQPAAPAKKDEPAAEVKQTTKQSQKTLTNTMSANRPLTARERAILAFKGEDKN